MTSARASQSTQIDRRSVAPYYHQLREILLERIRTEWSAGHKLPSEAALCDHYGVSRTVVRQALDDLSRSGVLHKVKGKGAFVTGEKLDAGFIQRPLGFYEAMRQQGHTVRSRILVQQIVPATVYVAQRLHLPIEAPLVQLDRLRFVNDKPIEVVRTFLPEALCPGLADIPMEDQSLYETLEQEYSLRPWRGSRTIEAAGATETDAELLDVSPGSPVLIMESVTEDPNGVPFEHFVAVLRSDRAKFDILFVASRGDLP
jgi:GntR family transcriptional regulator